MTRWIVTYTQEHAMLIEHDTADDAGKRALAVLQASRDEAERKHMIEMTREQVQEVPAEFHDQINVWLARGDGVAVYENQDMGDPNFGQVKLVSFGSPNAQLEMDVPPVQLPDIGAHINWRYRLAGTYQGPPL